MMLMLMLLGIFYMAMVAAGYAVEFLFGGLGLIPATRAAKVYESRVTWNYTTVLNIILLLLAAALIVRFFRTGGGQMLKMMGAVRTMEVPVGLPPSRPAACQAEPA